MLMRLSALKQLCAMNGPKKELVRRARDTFPVKKSLWSTATKDNQLFFFFFFPAYVSQKLHPEDHMIFDGLRLNYDKSTANHMNSLCLTKTKQKKKQTKKKNAVAANFACK